MMQRSLKLELLHERARELREARIRLLQLCVCAWPVKEYKTASGHHRACPAHAEITKDDDE